MLFATVILALGKLRQEERELQTCLGHITRACLHKLSAELSTEGQVYARKGAERKAKPVENLGRARGDKK